MRTQATSPSYPHSLWACPSPALLHPVLLQGQCDHVIPTTNEFCQSLSYPDTQPLAPQQCPCHLTVIVSISTDSYMFPSLSHSCSPLEGPLSTLNASPCQPPHLHPHPAEFSSSSMPLMAGWHW